MQEVDWDKVAKQKEITKSNFIYAVGSVLFDFCIVLVLYYLNHDAAQIVYDCSLDLYTAGIFTFLF